MPNNVLQINLPSQKLTNSLPILLAIIHFTNSNTINPFSIEYQLIEYQIDYQIKNQFKFWSIDYEYTYWINVLNNWLPFWLPSQIPIMQLLNFNTSQLITDLINKLDTD